MAFLALCHLFSQVLLGTFYNYFLEHPLLGAGEEERGGGPLLLRHGVVIRGGGGGVVDGADGPGSLNELDEVSSSSLPCNHCRRWGPVRAERKVAGEPEGSRLKTGAAEEEMSQAHSE